MLRNILGIQGCTKAHRFPQHQKLYTTKNYHINMPTKVIQSVRRNSDTLMGYPYVVEIFTSEVEVPSTSDVLNLRHELQNLKTEISQLTEKYKVLKYNFERMKVGHMKEHEHFQNSMNEKIDTHFHNLMEENIKKFNIPSD